MIKEHSARPERIFLGGAYFLFFISVVALSAFAQVQSSAKNVRIEVQIKSAGYSQGPSVLGERVTRKSSETQFLIVMDGLEGRLFIGRQVPYAVWYWNYLKNEGYLTGQIVFKNVGTSLIVTPRIRGDQIEVTLTPEISYKTNDGSGSISVTRLSTTVIVPNGHPIEVGAGLQESEFADNFYTKETGEAVRVVMVPTVMETY